MANFSIEWLSKSFYPTHKDGEPDNQSAPRPDTAPPGRTISIEVLSKDKYPPTSPNNSCGYTSGSESEQGDEGDGGDGGGEGEASSLHRRMRTKFTSEQIGRLENTFGKHRYLGATQRRKMAEKLNLSETQVKTWFQNRRMKLKRDLQDVRPDFFFSAAPLLPPFLCAPPPRAPAFQHRALRGQLPAHMHPIMAATPYYY